MLGYGTYVVVVAARHEGEEDEAAAGEFDVGVSLDLVGGVDAGVVLAALAVGVLRRLGLVAREVEAEATLIG